MGLLSKAKKAVKGVVKGAANYVSGAVKSVGSIGTMAKSIFSKGGIFSTMMAGITSKLGMGSLISGSLAGNTFGNLSGSFLGGLTKSDGLASFSLNSGTMPNSLTGILQSSIFSAPVGSSLASNPFSKVSSVDTTLRLANPALPTFQSMGNIRI